MMAGLRKQKTPRNPVLGESALLKTQAATSVTNRTATTAASTAGLTLLTAAAARSGALPISISKLNAPGLSPSLKGNYSAHSPLAIANKALGGLDQLNSTLRTLSPVAANASHSTLPSNVTATTLRDHSSSNSTLRNRSLHPHSFANMTTTTVPPQNGSVPPQNARAGSTPPQNSRAVSTSLHYARSVSTPPQTIRPVTAPLLPTTKDSSDTQSSVYSLSGRSSPNQSTAQASTRVPSPTSSTLSLPSSQPRSVADNPSVQPQGSSRPSTPALSISSSCDLESSHSLSGINLQNHPRDGNMAFKDGTCIRTPTPSRSESPVTVSAGEGRQQSGQVEDQDDGETPLAMQLGGGGARGEAVLRNGGIRSQRQVPENGSLQKPEPKKLKLDPTVTWDNVDMGLQPATSERTLHSPLVQRTASSADEVRDEGTQSPSTPVVTTTRHDCATATERTDGCTVSGSQTSRTDLRVSSDASSLIATTNGWTNVTTNSTLQESCLAAAHNTPLTCSIGSWAGSAAPTMVTVPSVGRGTLAHTPSLMTSSSSCSSDTGTDNDRSMDIDESSVSSEPLPHPLSTEVGGTRCVCSWDVCNRYHHYCGNRAAPGHPSVISVSQMASRITVGALVTRCCTSML